jgi:hypothetical protein
MAIPKILRTFQNRIWTFISYEINNDPNSNKIKPTLLFTRNVDTKTDKNNSARFYQKLCVCYKIVFSAVDEFKIM